MHARGALDELRASLSGDAALGADVFASALSAPLCWVAVNAGLDGSVAVNKVAHLPKGQGVNARHRPTATWSPTVLSTR